MSKQSKYTKSARGQECQVRIPLICNHNAETVVFTHLNGAGMAFKHSDIHGAYACSNCHDVVDGRVTCSHYTDDEKKLMHLQGMVRTQQIMIRDGVIKL